MPPIIKIVQLEECGHTKKTIDTIKDFCSSESLKFITILMRLYIYKNTRGALFMNIDISYLWQKLAFQLVHKTTIWTLLVFLTTAGVSWHLGNLLDKHNARAREANMAHKTAIGYTATALLLWIFSFIMG